MTDEEIFSLKAIKLNVFVERQIYQVLFLKSSFSLFIAALSIKPVKC